MSGQRIILLFVAMSGFFYVMLGAMGAHMLSDLLSSKEMDWLETGLKYQGFHTLALFGLALLMCLKSSVCLKYSALFMVIGIILFSGSLYTLALTSFFVWPYITPLGGAFFLLGWLMLLIAVLNDMRSSS